MSNWPRTVTRLYLPKTISWSDIHTSTNFSSGLILENVSKTVICWIECCVLSCGDVTRFSKNISGLTEICHFHPRGESFSFSSLLPAANSHYSASFYPVNLSIQMMKITFIFSILQTEIEQGQQSAETTQASTLIYSYYVFLRCLSSRSVLLWWLQTGKKAWKTPWSNDSLKTWTLHSFIPFLTIEDTRVWFDC